MVKPKDKPCKRHKEPMFKNVCEEFNKVKHMYVFTTCFWCGWIIKDRLGIGSEELE